MTVRRVEPATGDNFAAVEDLFGANGACGGCWCMWWRVPRSEYRKGAGNHTSLRDLVGGGEPVGLLAFGTDGRTGAELPIGWCAVGPRSSFRRLATAAVGRGGGDEPDRWAVPCFFVRTGFRRRGVTGHLLAAACEYGRAHGARVIEGYPSISPKASASDLYVGTRGMFERQGFATVRQPSPARLVMERHLD